MPGRVRTEIHLGTAQTGGAFCLLVDQPPAGWELPAHRHRHEAETIHVLSGEFEMDLGGRRTRLARGETVHIPAGEVHAGANVGEAVGRRILLFHPAGLERFFREVGASSADAAVDSRAVLAAADRHGWEFVSRTQAAAGSSGAAAIRRARPGQVAEITALWDAAYERERTPDTAAALEPLLEGTGPACLLVAEDDGRVVGTVIAAWDGWRGNLYRLVVARDRRRQGIARALVRAAEDELRALGATRVSALVAREDDAAAALWADAGYRVEPTVGRWVKAV